MTNAKVRSMTNAKEIFERTRRGWAETKTETSSKNQNWFLFDWDTRNTANRPQFSCRKQKEYILTVHLFKKWKAKVRAKDNFLILSSWKLLPVCRYLLHPIEQEPILVIAQSFGFSFCSTPTCDAEKKESLHLIPGSGSPAGTSAKAVLYYYIIL